MRKLIIAGCFPILAALAGQAQMRYTAELFTPQQQSVSTSPLYLGDKVYLNLNVLPLIRVGNVRDSLLPGYAILAEGEVFITDNIAAGLQTGYMRFKTDPVSLGEGNHSFIPVCLKASYYFLEEPFKPFAGLSLGYYIGKKDYDFIGPKYYDPVLAKYVEGKLVSRKLTTNAFGISPMAGFQYFVTDDIAAHFGAQFNMIFTESKSTNFAGIRFGVIYTLPIM